MLKNYLIVAWRNLAKQKGLSLISVSGLAVGIACFCLCVLYVRYERSFDRFHAKGDQIYRVLVVNHQSDPGPLGAVSAFQCGPLGPAMKKDLPGVMDFVRCTQPAESFVKAGHSIGRESVTYADPSFFSMFSFPLKEGVAATALQDPHSVVVTESAARQLFGSAEAMGQRIEVEMEGQFHPFTVSGVAVDPAANSSVVFQVVCNIQGVSASMSDEPLTAWRYFGPFFTFVQLAPRTGLAWKSQLPDAFWKRYFTGEKNPARHFELEPLREIHTDTRLSSFYSMPTVDAGTLRILLGLATAVLLIACINFTTLSIGRSAGRATEVGVRKVIGGSRRMLLAQFLIESLLLTVIAAALGLGLAHLLLPLFERLAEVSLPVNERLVVPLAGLFFVLVPVVALLAGSYPAFVLSGFRPVEVLKAKIRVGGGNFFTKSLVTLQFVLSAGLIITAVIVLQQLRFMQSRNPGFNKENVVTVDGMDVPDIDQKYTVFRQALAARPEILGVGAADNRMGHGGGAFQSGYKDKDSVLTLYSYFVDEHFMRVMNMQLIAGREFEPAIAHDTIEKWIINEAMARVLGLSPEAALGKRLPGYSEARPPVVIGVVRDFDFFADLHRRTEPMYFHNVRLNIDHYQDFFVRVRPGDPSQALAAIDAAWKKAAPGYALKYHFVDEDLDRWYAAARRMSRLILTAGVLSIVLACLGLFGLAALAATNRTKEIGIRRVLGASMREVVGLLSKDFLRLVGLAFLLATPISWWLMHRWLQDYAYRIDIRWWVFAVTGAGMLGIAMLTVGWQGLQAAWRNPVTALRAE